VRTETSLLEDLGVDAAAEAAYLYLIDQPGATLEGIARSTGFSRRVTRGACDLLETKGLISRSPSRPIQYQPAPPDVAIDALVLQQRERLERVRLAGTELVARYRRRVTSRTRVDEFVEVIAGREAIAQRFRQIQATVEREILVFDKPPYVVQPSENESSEASVLRRQVTTRAIYDASSLTPDQLRLIQRLITQGERARTTHDLPMKLIIADRRVALVPLRQDEPGLEGRLLIHSSPLLDALIVLFEAVWERATPLRVLGASVRQEEHRKRLSEDDRLLLAMLAAGLKDEVIAQRLGVTERTVARRLRQLFAQLDAQTRFQAGLSAGRRGWLE
jgi:sugar-specific transcriptional regulator TrmB/DNA-binding CsgD family transcriptional regulator